MNHTLQVGLAWFGGISAIGYAIAGAWICIVGAHEHRRIQNERTALRARRKPLTEADIQAVDFDAELANLTKENGR